MMALVYKLIEKILPAWIYDRLIGQWNQDGLKKYFKNTSWIFSHHAVSFVTSFFTVAIVARYLGPENLGKLTYAQSFVALFSIIASLGIDEIVYRDFIARPEKRSRIMGTAIFAKFFFGIIAFIAVVASSFAVDTDKTITLLVAITASTFFLNPIGVIGTFFNSQVASKYNARISIFLAFFLPGVKLLLIFFGKGIIYFAATLLLEVLISSMYLLYIYKRHFYTPGERWAFEWQTFKKMFHDAWPLILAGLSAQVYSRIDSIMLQHFIDSTSVGIYSSATKITQIAQTIPGIIIAGLLPAIHTARRHSHDMFLKRLRALMGVNLLIALAMIIPVLLLAPLVIFIIFGSEFMSAVPILRVHIFATIGIVFVAIVHHYLIAENYGKIYFRMTIIGATVNTLLNIVLIPRFDIMGAAITTLVSYVAMSLSLLFFTKTRKDLVRIVSFK